MIPMHALFFVTIPDCRRPGKWHKTYPITFVMSIAWIAGLSYIMVWMVTVAGKVIVLLIDLFVLFFISSKISHTQKERLHHCQWRTAIYKLYFGAYGLRNTKLDRYLCVQQIIPMVFFICIKLCKQTLIKNLLQPPPPLKKNKTPQRQLIIHYLLLCPSGDILSLIWRRHHDRWSCFSLKSKTKFYASRLIHLAERIL